MAVHVHINQSQLRELLSGPNGPVVREVTRIARRVSNQAKRFCPVDEGALRASIDFAVIEEPGRVTARIGSPLQYAIYVHEGTGIYGKRRRRITPISAKYLVFEGRNRRTTAKGRGNLVFAKSVAGQRPQPFLVRALQAESPWPVVLNPLD